jgi:hypothetical protein
MVEDVQDQVKGISGPRRSDRIDKNGMKRSFTACVPRQI